jgi:hypothetical protein
MLLGGGGHADLALSCGDGLALIVPGNFPAVDATILSGNEDVPVGGGGGTLLSDVPRRQVLILGPDIPAAVLTIQTCHIELLALSLKVPA